MTHTMEPPRSPGGTTRTSMNTALGELSALLPGQVTRPGEPEWDRIRYGFNLAVDQQPVAVVTAVDEEDVVATVRWANRYGADRKRAAGRPRRDQSHRRRRPAAHPRAAARSSSTRNAGWPGSAPASSGARCSPRPRRTA